MVNAKITIGRHSAVSHPFVGQWRRQMTIVIASQLLGFILGGGAFLLRYDRPGAVIDR